MKIGLASYTFKNNDVAFNVGQMEKALEEARGKADLLCFGETFLQGFDALCWQYAVDREIAVPQDAPVMKKIAALSARYGMGILFGYIERAGEALYSSCAVMENGALLHNYRRISTGWKESARTDHHYREGEDTGAFLFRGVQMTIALCGDLWDAPERFRTDGLLIWPVYVNYDLAQWRQEEKEYARQAHLAAEKTLMVNSLSENPRAYGGAFCFFRGRILQKTAYGEENILFLSV